MKTHDKRPQPADCDERYPISEMEGFNPKASYLEMRQLCPEGQYMVNIRSELEFQVKGKDIRVAVRCSNLHFKGRTFYVKKECVSWACYKNGKFSGDSFDLVFGRQTDLQEKVFAYLGLGWMKEIPNSKLRKYAFSSSIFRSILAGTIYSQETLTKAIAKRIFHLEKTDWRVLRDYLLLPDYDQVSVCNLMDFTKDATMSMRRLLKAHETELYSIMADMVYMAVKTGTVVDLKWSEKRIREEHQNQIYKAHAKELGRTNVEDIYDDATKQALTAEHVELLGNEKRVCEEGLLMHHCIYTCYWQNIKEHRYVAFHMSSPEDCTFGVRMEKGKPVLDQIYCKYDIPVQEATENLAKQFVEDHEPVLVRIMTREADREKIRATLRDFETEDEVLASLHPDMLCDREIDIPF